jgi:hypothetical protein
MKGPQPGDIILTDEQFEEQFYQEHLREHGMLEEYLKRPGKKLFSARDVGRRVLAVKEDGTLIVEDPQDKD